MKTAAKFLGLFLVGMMMMACEEITGTVQIKESFQALEGRLGNCGNLHCAQQQQLTAFQPGQHDFEFEVVGRDHARLTILVNKQKRVLELGLPSDKKIPINGDYDIASDESGQPFHLASEIKTEVTESPNVRTVETCTRTWVEKKCENTPQGEVCKNVRLTRTGQQNVEFFDRTTTRNMKAQLIGLKTNKVLASFDGSHVNATKVYTYEGNCE